MKSLQQIAFDSGIIIGSKIIDRNSSESSRLSYIISELIMPLSDLDFMGLNRAINGTTYDRRKGNPLVKLGCMAWLPLKYYILYKAMNTMYN